ncbi:MAG: preprotein translocase subunit YajC [Actinomycetota bacterium]|jgi:preprotein translocase subunit YajC|nr:preprotein translocase subunit YajC [Actinomycetota bacterium]
MASLLPFVLIVAMMWLLLIRPQQQRVRKQQALLKALEVGDEVITAGGMLGRIRTLDDERIEIEVAPGVVVSFLRGAVSQRLVDAPKHDDDDDEAIVVDDRDDDR